MDNPSTPAPDNASAPDTGAQDAGVITPDQVAVPDTGAVAVTDPAPVVAPTSTDAGALNANWKSQLGTDLRDSPLMQKFEDTPDGLNKAMESHANLEQLLGHDKVPIPKDANDIEGWNRFSKAMGIPDKAENYGLADAVIPDSMKGMTMDKGKFAEIAHAHKCTPAQAKGLWETYQQTSRDAFTQATTAQEKSLTETVNRLKGEWGDSYDVNVELGQMVINKFSDDAEMNDYLTATLSQDPRGIKFLAKVGDQFAENKIGEFQMKKFTLGPEEAQEKVAQMTHDINGPYMNASGKFTAKEHQAAIDQVNSLISSIQRSR